MKMDIKEDFSLDDKDTNNKEVEVVPSHFDVKKGIPGVALAVTTIDDFGSSTSSTIFKTSDARKIGEALIKQADSIDAEVKGGFNTRFTSV